MLSDDSEASTTQKHSIWRALYEPPNGLNEIRKFHEILTMQLVRQNSAKLGKVYHFDAVRIVGNASHANFIAYLFKMPLYDCFRGVGQVNDLEVYGTLALIFEYVFVDVDPPKAWALKAAAADAVQKMKSVIQNLFYLTKSDDHVQKRLLRWNMKKGPAADSLMSYGIDLNERLAVGGKGANEVMWTIILTAAMATATQVQRFAHMLDLYLSDRYKSHWPAIQKLAASNTPEAFEQLKRYALEGYRLNTPAFGLTRIAVADTMIDEG